MNMDSKETKFGFLRFIRSFGYAINGLKAVWSSEQNFRIHVFTGILVFLMAFILSVSMTEWIILILLVFGMLSLETMNTAIEKSVDLTVKEFHPLAKAAKDLASAAVLLFAICTAIIGCLIFIPKLYDAVKEFF